MDLFMRLLNSIVSTAAGALLMAAATAASAAGALVDAQFSAYSGEQQSGAAVLGSAGDYWNDFIGSASGSGALLTTTGDNSGISLSFSSALLYRSEADFTRFTSTPYQSLMNDYLVAYESSDIELKLSGLATNQDYGFVIYTQGDDNSVGRQISLTANGTTTVIATQTNTNSFTLGNNYVYFVTRADAQGDVDIIGHDLVGEANINGFQLMPVPEPSTAALAVAGLLFVAGAALRKRGR